MNLKCRITRRFRNNTGNNEITANLPSWKRVQHVHALSAMEIIHDKRQEYERSLSSQCFLLALQKAQSHRSKNLRSENIYYVVADYNNNYYLTVSKRHNLPCRRWPHYSQEYRSRHEFSPSVPGTL